MKKIREVKDVELEKVIGGSLVGMKIIGPKQMGPDGMTGSGGTGAVYPENGEAIQWSRGDRREWRRDLFHVLPAR